MHGGLINMGAQQPSAKRSYAELEHEVQAAQGLALQLAVRCAQAELERNMLARKLQEHLNPAPDPAAVELSNGITAAIRTMQSQNIR